MAGINRRTFLKLVSAALIPRFFDPRSPSPVRTRFEENIIAAIGARGMGVDVRKLDSNASQLFGVQVNPYNYYPIASCFKAFLILYYFWNTPQEEWEYEEGSTAYSVAVFSNNPATGDLLDEVGSRIRGSANAIEKFNDFLTFEMFMPMGIYSWNWEGSATVDIVDARYAPRPSRAVRIPAGEFLVDNVCTAADLATGYMFLARTDNDLAAHPYFQDVLTATRELLSIPAEGYESPIERTFPNGYTGKDGVLPSDQLPVGRVLGDAGIIWVNDGAYIVSFMSAGESETAVLDVLRVISAEIENYQSYMQFAPFSG